MWGGTAAERKDGGPSAKGTGSTRNGTTNHEDDLFLGGGRHAMMGINNHRFYRTFDGFGGMPGIGGGKDLPGSSINGHPERRPTVLWKGDTMRKRRFEAFCSPIVPHVPIRERLAYRRCTSVDAHEDVHGSMSSFGMPRRRKMSLLQSLRQQNKQLADSGLDMARQRTDSESSPPTRGSPPTSPTKGGPLGVIKSKTKALFGGRKERPLESRRTMHSMHMTDCSQSCDPINGRSRKSPSTTNDSGRGSQGHLDERLQLDERGELLLESVNHRVEHAVVHAAPKRGRVIVRTSSCPNIVVSLSPPTRWSTSSRNGAPIVVPEADDEIVFVDKDEISDYEHRLCQRTQDVLRFPNHLYGHRASNAV